MNAPFTRVIERRDFERILGERPAESLQRDPDEAYRDAVFAKIRDGLKLLAWGGLSGLVVVASLIWALS